MWIQELSRLIAESAKSKNGQSDIAHLNNQKQEKSNEHVVLQDEILNNVANETNEKKPSRLPRYTVETFSAIIVVAAKFIAKVCY